MKKRLLYLDSACKITFGHIFSKKSKKKVLTKRFDMEKNDYYIWIQHEKNSSTPLVKLYRKFFFLQKVPFYQKKSNKNFSGKTNYRFEFLDLHYIWSSFSVIIKVIPIRITLALSCLAWTDRLTNFNHF